MKSDISFLYHVLDEIDYILTLVDQQNITISDFMENETLKRAFSRSIEIMGEAVKKLSPDFCVSHPDIPWKQIAGMRDRIIHGYFSVDYELIWDVVENHLPALYKSIVGLL